MPRTFMKPPKVNFTVTQSLQAPRCSSSAVPSNSTPTLPPSRCSITTGTDMGVGSTQNGSGGPSNADLDPAIDGLDLDLPAARGLGRNLVGGVDGERALGAQQVRHAHAGQHPA